VPSVNIISETNLLKFVKIGNLKSFRMTWKYIARSTVADPWNFGTDPCADPDPRIHISD
jgi:hypothetical protein